MGKPGESAWRIFKINISGALGLRGHACFLGGSLRLRDCCQEAAQCRTTTCALEIRQTWNWILVSFDSSIWSWASCTSEYQFPYLWTQERMLACSPMFRELTWKYMKLLAHSVALKWACSSAFPSAFWKVCRRKNFVTKSVDNDSGMLIFTQISTSHKTTHIMLITGKRSHRILWCEFSFLPIKIWMKVIELKKKKKSVLCYIVASFPICE